MKIYIGVFLIMANFKLNFKKHFGRKPKMTALIYIIYNII